MLNGKMVSMVAAMGKNRVIGAGNDIPWKAPGEQRRFRELTEGQLVVMGRRTYQSIGRPLPNRDVLVIGSHALAVQEQERLSICATFDAAADVIATDTRGEAFIAGGGQIYRLFLPYADIVYLTEVDIEPAGDTVFPELPADFECTERVAVDGPIQYAFLTYRHKI